MYTKSNKSKKNNPYNCYFNLTGRIGRYENYDIALANTSNGRPGDVLELNKKYFKKSLVNELFRLAKVRKDLDYTLYNNYINEDMIESIIRMQDSNYFTSVYINRLISNNYYSYALILQMEENLYRYSNVLKNMTRGDSSDIVPLVYVKHLEDKFGIKGNIIYHAPVEKEIKMYLPEWNYIKYDPRDYNIVMEDVNNILLNKPTILTVKDLRGDLYDVR